MAYVITAVGAGGKTSFLKHKAARYLREGKTALLVTTTHIWGPQGSGWSRSALTDEEGREKAFLWKKEGEADLAGILQPDGKLSALPPAIFRKLCENYDCVLVEGDGSHCMPVKIPSEREPVVPENTDEIAVVTGRHALGRKLQAVCQRFAPDRLRTLGYEDGAAAVTEKMLRTIAEEFYIRPLTEQFPKAKLHYVESDLCASGFDQDVKKISLVLMASGFSRRYGGNKLLEERGGKKLYRLALDHILEAVLPEAFDGERAPSADSAPRTGGSGLYDGEQDLSDDSTPRTGGSGLYDEERGPSADSIIREGQPEPYDPDREVQILVVTQYEEIREEVSRLSEELGERMEAGKRRVSLQPVRNMHAAEGISASIRLGTEAAMNAGSDAVVFFAADMPALPPAEIRLFLKQFLASGKRFACMESMPGHIPTNPGAFRLTKDNCGKLIKLAGDHGAMKIIKAAPRDAYYYQIGEADVRDIDEREKSSGNCDGVSE